MTAAHPTDETLAAYGLGRLDGTAAGGVAGHLDGCETCRRRVAALTADSFVGKLRACQSGTGYTGLSAAVRAMPAADDRAVPPELLALTQYTGLKELGRGGMGVVYVARNTDLDRLEVLKVVQRGTLERAGAGAVERFLREMQAAARLQHPNVVTAYAVHRPGDLLVFAMEYAPGQDLAKLVKAKGPLPVPVACSFAHTAALGLQHAHEAGMVHRDVKPGNLILTRVHGKPTVKVLDFGLAKVTAGDRVSTDLTGDGKMMGTPDYLAPEQAEDAARADIRADVYSLGCTLYHLLAGRSPFAGGSLLQVIDRHRFTEATPLNLVQPTVPAELAAAVAKMMAKDPARRYQTPLEAAKAVRPFIAQPAVKPTAPPAPRPATADTSRPEQTAPERPAPAPQPEPAADSGTVVVPVPAAPPPRRRLRLLAWLVVGAALNLLGGMLLYGVVFKTPQGTIHIDGVPADATVELDGATATVTRASEAVTLTAVPGEHTLRVVQNGVELAVQGGAVVTVGGQPVRVRVDPPAKPAPTPAPPAKPADSPAPASPPTPPDKLAAGSVWHGTRTYTKGSWLGTTVNFELHVKQRDGTKFSGHVFDNGTGRNESQVVGDVTGTAIRWTETSNYNAGKLYLTTGTLDGTTIRANQVREADGKAVGESYVILTLPDAGKGFRKGDPVPPVPPPVESGTTPLPSDGFVPLFNGKDLAGWKTHPSQPGNWRVEYGVLVGRGPGGQSYLYSDAAFADFHLRAEYRVNAAGNSGVFFRAAPPAAEIIPDGYEAQINYSGNSGPPTGSLYAAKQVVVPVLEPAGKAGDWCVLEVVAVGAEVAVSVNGVQTAKYADPKRAHTRGRIALQKHDPQTVIEFRKIEMKALALPLGIQKLQASGPQLATERSQTEDEYRTPPEAAALLSAARSARQKLTPVVPPKDLAGWGEPGAQLENWSVGDDGVLVGAKARGMIFPRGVALSDFYLRYEAMADNTTLGGVVLRRRVRGFPNEKGTRHSGYYVPICTVEPGLTGQIRRWRNFNSFEKLTPSLASSTFKDCLPREWYTFEDVAVANRIAVFINNKFASYWREPSSDPRLFYNEGVLAFRIERGTVSFRNVVVRELDATLLPELKK